MISGLAKVILLGEHAVVYGHPALAGAVDRRVFARARGPAPRLSVECKAWALAASAGDDSAVGRALSSIASGLGGAPSVALEVRSDLPAGSGLGSSAALCVAITRCLAEAKNQHLSTEELERIANLGEEAFHSRPSGIDVAMASRGGLGLFDRQTGLERVHAAPVELAIGLTGRARSTAAMVESVARQRVDKPGVDDELAALGELATLGARALEAGRPAELGALFDDAQERLARLELSCPEIHRMIEVARGAGSSGAKLTGAGGGGAVIAIADDPHEVTAAWEASGFTAFVARVGVLP